MAIKQIKLQMQRNETKLNVSKGTKHNTDIAKIQ